MEHVSTSDASFFEHFGRFDEASDLSNLAEIVSASKRPEEVETLLVEAMGKAERISAEAPDAGSTILLRLTVMNRLLAVRSARATILGRV
jgi:hypothetical protein